MSESPLLVERRGPVLCMGLNRPEKRNALDLDGYVALAQAYGELDRDPELRVGVVYAVGEHFTAGLDLPKWVPAFAGGQLPALPDGALEPFGLDPARRVRKPVIFALQGVCYTCGIELMLAGDIRIAATDTRFGQIEVKRGIYAVGGATLRFFQEIGWGNAMRYLLTGDEISAHEAYRMGLVQELVEPGRQFDRALTLANTIAQQAPLGVQATLASARLAKEQGEAAAIARLFPDLLPLMASDDAKEGVAAFMARRPAQFVGR
ncbi:crotonase/enoyl-CoA hydratase family protein [Chitinivorax sp. PXF-14]|uniref:crotonase/enoyl-CoA hydratase family protein n=1 Tax=Chitinivorax sp. PXF-14 TaxID=3230488 RepID=UPI003467A2CD